MVYANKVARITLNGTMFNDSEYWSTGFYMGAVGADATMPTEAFLQIVDDAWHTFFTRNYSYISSAYKTTEIRGTLLDAATGKSIGAGLDHFVATPYAGGSGSQSMPPQISLVATLCTDTPRGIGSKGRMFLPGINAPVGPDGHLVDTYCTDILTGLHDFFAVLQGSVEQPGRLITASKGSKPPIVGPPVNRDITHLRVGNVYDTQRRRRNGLKEQYYQSATLV